MKTFGIPEEECFKVPEDGMVMDGFDGVQVFEGLVCRSTRAVMDEDRAILGELVKTSSSERLPGGAKVVLKQLFSGQMGLTYSASYQFGMVVGVPLDLHTGWDASTKDGLRIMHRELLQKRPLLPRDHTSMRPMGLLVPIQPLSGWCCRCNRTGEPQQGTAGAPGCPAGC
jgi:hypothetical protein